MSSEDKERKLGPNMDCLDEIKHWQNIELPKSVVETRIRELLEGLPIGEIYVREETVKRYENGQGSDITKALKRMGEKDMIFKGTAILRDYRDLHELSYRLGPSFKLIIENTYVPNAFNGRIVGGKTMVGFWIGKDPVECITSYASQ